MQELIKSGDQTQTFSSKYLVEQINLFRKEEGNAIELLHKNLLTKIESEFEEEIGGLKIKPTSYLDSSNRQSKCYELDFEQSLQILMSESKSVRKRCIEVMKAQQKQIESLSVPKTFKEALLLAVAQQEKIEEQEKQLLLQAPKVEFAEQLLGTTNGIDFGTSAKAMKLPFGRNKLFEICRKLNVLMNNNVPYQNYVDSGYFVVIESSFNNPKSGDRILTFKTLITAKGQEWLIKKINQNKSK
jgi:anti-repressor protein